MRSSGLLAALALSSLCGCMVSANTALVPATKFVYPNSNVIPMTETSGSVSKLCGFIIPFGTPDASYLEDATAEALGKVHGADLLIDAHADNKVISGPMFPFPFLYLCSVSVRGTAAKMEVGRQALDAKAKKRRPKTCATADDCGAGQTCVEGACAAEPAKPPPAAAECAMDRDCPGELICNDHRCVKPRGQ